MPYIFKKQKCKQTDGDVGKYVVYKKEGHKKVGCTNDPEQYRKALHAAEGGYIKKENRSFTDILKEMIKDELALLAEKSKKGKKDACYYKVRARYDAWPSAYASGALSKCRKVGADNWGNSKDD